MTDSDTRLNLPSNVSLDEIEDAGSISKPSALDTPLTRELEVTLHLRKQTQYVLLVLFTLTNATTVLLFLLRAWDKVRLSDVALGELATITIAEVAPMLIISIRYLFPSKSSGARSPRRPGPTNKTQPKPLSPN